MILYLSIFIYLALSLSFYLEYRNLSRYRKSFRAIIHVSGIRGKTSTCRILDAALRTKYRVYTKTTGTDAAYIDTHNQEHPIRRWGPANIKEQIHTIRHAWKEHAEILILECMAVRPELQRISQDAIVKSSISIITNVRYDHPFEMGFRLSEIAESLSAVIPENGILYTAAQECSDLLAEKCTERNSRFILCNSEIGESENISIARSVCLDLGISNQIFEDSLNNIKHDFGVLKQYRFTDSANISRYFLNLFSVNDPISSQYHAEHYIKPGQSYCFIYNNRSDRPDRIILFSKYFFPNFPEAEIFLIGDCCHLAKKIIKQNNSNSITILREWNSLFDSPGYSLIIGIGNIKNTGCSIIEYLEEHYG